MNYDNRTIQLLCKKDTISLPRSYWGDWPVDNTNDFIMNWQLLIVWHAKGEVDKTIDIKQSYIFVEQP